MICEAECVRQETSKKCPARSISRWSGSQKDGVCGYACLGLPTWREALAWRREHRAKFSVQGSILLHTFTLTRSHAFLHTHIHTHTHTHTHNPVSHSNCCRKCEPDLHVPGMWNGCNETPIEFLLYAQHCPRNVMCHCARSSECFPEEEIGGSDRERCPDRHTGQCEGRAPSVPRRTFRVAPTWPDDPRTVGDGGLPIASLPTSSLWQCPELQKTDRDRKSVV